MILLTASLLHAAQDCHEPLLVRDFYPRSGEDDVPVDMRVLVGFIGWGTPDEYEVILSGPSELPIESVTESWCYEHEGPHEVHCWITVKPEEPLLPQTTYNADITTTAKWPHAGDIEIRSQFTTGTGSTPPFTQAPSLAITNQWTKKNKACGYTIANRYDLAPELTYREDDTGGAVFHIYALDEHGEPGDIIHTILSGTNSSTSEKIVQMKQYLDGSVPQTDCFRIIEEDFAGNRSEHYDTCEFKTATPDTGLGDTAPPQDTAQADTAAPDTAPPEEADELATISAEVTCGCAGEDWTAALLVVPLLALRRRGSYSGWR